MYKLHKAIVTNKPVIFNTVNNKIILGHPESYTSIRYHYFCLFSIVNWTFVYHKAEASICLLTRYISRFIAALNTQLHIKQIDHYHLTFVLSLRVSQSPHRVRLKWLVRTNLGGWCVRKCVSYLLISSCGLGKMAFFFTIPFYVWWKLWSMMPLCTCQCCRTLMRTTRLTFGPTAILHASTLKSS